MIIEHSIKVTLDNGEIWEHKDHGWKLIQSKRHESGEFVHDSDPVGYLISSLVVQAE